MDEILTSTDREFRACDLLTGPVFKSKLIGNLIACSLGKLRFITVILYPGSRKTPEVVSKAMYSAVN